MISSGNLGWDVTTDPDGHPDRLLDVAALLGSSDGLDVWASPARVVVPAAAMQRTFSVQLQRSGGFAGPVTVAATGLPAAVGTVSVPPGSLDGMAAVEVTATLDVAADAPDGDYPVTVTASGPGGTPSASTHLTIHVDGTLPVVAAPWPGVVLRSGGTFDGSALARLTWSASDAAPGVVAHLELQRRSGSSGTWTRLAYGGPSLLASDVALAPGAGARFRVRATDDAGNVGTSSVLVSGLRLRESDDPVIDWSTGWTTHQRGTASGHSLRSSSLAGATADLGFNGRGIAWVAPLGHGKGSARVSIDGQVVATVHLSSTQGHPRRIVFASSQLPAGAHALRIEVLSGVGRPGRAADPALTRSAVRGGGRQRGGAPAYEPQLVRVGPSPPSMPYCALASRTWWTASRTRLRWSAPEARAATSASRIASWVVLSPTTMSMSAPATMAFTAAGPGAKLAVMAAIWPMSSVITRPA